MRVEPELLRYIALVLIGLVFTAAGIVMFLLAGQLTSQLPAAVPKLTEFAPEALPPIQSLLSALPLIQGFSMLTVLTGLVTLISGIMSLLDYRKRTQQPAWNYYTGEPTPGQQQAV